MTPSPATRRARPVVALTAALLLAVAGLIGMVPAGAAVPDVTTDVSVTGATAADGLTLHVTGSGYTGLPNASTGSPSQGVYVALRDPATMTNDAINADSSIVPAVSFVYKGTIVDGAFSTDLTAAADALNPDAHWEIIVWVAHGNVTTDTLLATIPVDLTDAQKQALFPDWTPPTTTTTIPGETTTVPPSTTAPTTAVPTTVAPSSVTPTTQRHAAPTTTRPANQPGTTTAGLRCVTETTPGTAGTPSLSWGIKSSFVSYIESNIAKGRIDTSGGVTRTGNSFVWPTGSGALSSSGQGNWTFPGSVHFTGHDGALDLTLANLRVRVDSANSGVLIADVQSKDMDGNDVGGANIELATLAFTGLSDSGGTATPTLTAAGARAFANYYEAGQALDALTVSVNGGTGDGTTENCYDASGRLVTTNPVSAGIQSSSRTLATTGSNTTPLVSIGAVLSLLGLAAVLVESRRRHAAQSM